MCRLVQTGTLIGSEQLVCDERKLKVNETQAESLVCLYVLIFSVVFTPGHSFFYASADTLFINFMDF